MYISLKVEPHLSNLILFNSTSLFLKTLLKSLNDAKNFINITEEQIEIMLTCRKSCLTDIQSTGQKIAQIALTFPWVLTTIHKLSI